MFNIGPLELMVVLMVALIVVGPKRLPEIGRTIGKAFSELRRVQDEVRDTIRFDLDDDEPYTPPAHPAHPDPTPSDGPHPVAVEASSPPEEEAEPDGEVHRGDSPPDEEIRIEGIREVASSATDSEAPPREPAPRPSEGSNATDSAVPSTDAGEGPASAEGGGISNGSRSPARDEAG